MKFQLNLENNGIVLWYTIENTLQTNTEGYISVDKGSEGGGDIWVPISIIQFCISLVKRRLIKGELISLLGFTFTRIWILIKNEITEL
jgi:hypothetical protein